MKKNEVNTKIKEFCHKHRTPLIAGAALATGYLVGQKWAIWKMDVGMSVVCAANPGLEETLKNAIENYNNSRS